MKFDAQKALITYAGFLTAAVVGLLTTGAMRDAAPGRFTTLDVERINVREPDGTLRLTISNRESFPEVPWRGGEIKHINRDTAGILFMNDEGTESGGLVWGGYERDGRRYSSGSLTFDGYEQDQTVQLVGLQDGETRRSGLVVTDRPEASMKLPLAEGFADLPPAEQLALGREANLIGQPRAFLGRQASGASELVLRDAEGRRRLVLSVAPDGVAKIDFLDETGAARRTVRPEG